MDGEGYGQGHARTCELTWGPNISDGIFELEIFNVKNPASRSTQPEGTGSYDEAAYACYVGLGVELPRQAVGVTRSVLLNFYDCGSSVDAQGSKKVSLWRLFW